VGLGLGGLIGSLIVTVSEPGTFTTLFLLDAVTFLVYAAVLLVGVRVPRSAAVPHAPRSGYRAVARDGAFVRLAALNFLFVAAVVSLLNSAFPGLRAKRGGPERGRDRGAVPPQLGDHHRLPAADCPGRRGAPPDARPGVDGPALRALLVVRAFGRALRVGTAARRRRGSSR
jgi:hypothetical protein